MERFSARKLDELGRVVLPMEIRRRLGWKSMDMVSVYLVDDNTVMLQRTEDIAPPAKDAPRNAS